MKEELDIKMYKPYNDRTVYIVKDRFGNAATGHTAEEAMEYLNKRKSNNNQIITFRKTESKK